MNAPSKPAAKRAAATWTVYQVHEDAHATHRPTGDLIADVATILVQVDANVVTRTAGEACWHIAETTLRDRATSDNPPVLVASRNGTQYGLNEPRPYALKPTVERIR